MKNQQLSDSYVLNVEKLCPTSIDVIGTCLKKVMLSELISLSKPFLVTSCLSKIVEIIFNLFVTTNDF